MQRIDPQVIRHKEAHQTNHLYRALPNKDSRRLTFGCHAAEKPDTPEEIRSTRLKCESILDQKLY